MTDDKLWSARHARALSEARQDRGLEPSRFAPQNAISLRQLKELETEGCNSFYSERIKFDVGTRLLRKLGVTPEPLPEALPGPEFEPVPVPVISADAPALEPAAPPGPSASPTSGRTHVFWWAAGALTVLAAGVLALHPWQGPSSSLPSAALLPAPATSARSPDASTDSGTTAGTGAVPAASTSTEAATPPPPLAAASAAPQPRDASSSLCQFTGLGATFSPAQAAKAGDYVYLLAQQDTRLCLVDATGRETELTLAAGQGANITGQPPFKLAATHGAQVQVFYQGKRVAWPADASHVVLNQAARAP